MNHVRSISVFRWDDRPGRHGLNILRWDNRPGRRSRAFTLIELLTVIGIIALISSITIMGFRAVTKDAKRSSAKNAIMASLDTARAYAIKNNQVVLVAFVPRFVNETQTQIEVVTAAYTRASRSVNVSTGAGSYNAIFDCFRPINDTPSRRLPIGVNVAGPSYATDEDNTWYVASNLSKTSEEAGNVIGVMYGPDGTRRMNSPVNDSDFFWIDFNGDQRQTPDPTGQFVGSIYEMHDATDEICIELVPLLSVFDEQACREIEGDSDWTNSATRQAELGDYINKNADRINFNRYTGVAMK
ncbi:MAG TPA: prepilin-type N-terminal cleavage/methylation domain-containing protein [Phycisphaerales bacterium]|nr:prepilin-type N-terminal cleavage/methylation domain-containing protein [Phycisphaerales bacterium]